MDTNLIVDKLPGEWWKWKDEQFARARLIARALRISVSAINKYEITKELESYNHELKEDNPSGPNRLYSLKDVKKIRHNLGVRQENPLNVQEKKVLN